LQVQAAPSEGHQEAAQQRGRRWPWRRAVPRWSTRGGGKQREPEDGEDGDGDERDLVERDGDGCRVLTCF
jgi:hypothetical protein